ncbi:helix-turn-helix domain-containing protein [Pedobacter sp. Du54]|uniref:AraC family transcriptional regulator n=1 Tax=Pedobacter anseongensis TaxID=3133439 RepID=UPI0030B5B761
MLRIDQFNNLQQILDLSNDNAAHQIILFLDAQGALRIKRERVEIETGSTLFWNQGNIENINFAGRGWVVTFENMYLQHFLNEYAFARKLGLFKVLILIVLGQSRRQLVMERVELIRTEIGRGLSFDHLKLVFSLFLWDLVIENLSVAQPLDGSSDLNSHFLALLEDNFRIQRKSTFYADLLNLSSRKLNNYCREWFQGKIFDEVIRERLLSEAKFLLATTDLALKVISMDLGFCSQQHFRHYFKKHTGRNPTSFRAAQKGKGI